jgi:hypothetical protein
MTNSHKSQSEKQITVQAREQRAREVTQAEEGHRRRRARGRGHPSPNDTPVLTRVSPAWKYPRSQDFALD